MFSSFATGAFSKGTFQYWTPCRLKDDAHECIILRDFEFVREIIQYFKENSIQHKIGIKTQKKDSKTSENIKGASAQ